MEAQAQDLLLGIDVGGTSVKAGLFATSGELLQEGSVPTPPLVDGAAFDVVCGLLDSLLAVLDAVPANVLGVGLDVPAPVDESGSALLVPNAQIDIPAFAQALREHFCNAAVAVLNDANAAALGELWQGAAQGEKSMVMVTLGTGVGGGIVVDGKLVAGRHGAGGEIGHICVNFDEKSSCGCGRKGCLEQYASASGVVKSYLAACKVAGQVPVELEGPTDTYSIFKALAKGDACAQSAIDTMCEYLAIAFAHIAVVVDPATFVLGGGVSGSFGTFEQQLRERFVAHAMAPTHPTQIVPAALGNRAGIYGSAYQALVLARS